MIERGYSRDVRAASRYYVKTRQLDIAVARAATEAMRAERASSDGSSATMHIDLSFLRTIVTKAQQEVADGTVTV